jgi:hypothetical protein
MKSTSGIVEARWSLLANHGHVLAYIAADPATRLRDIAQTVGITEEQPHKSVNDLERAGYLARGHPPSLARTTRAGDSYARRSVEVDIDQQRGDAADRRGDREATAHSSAERAEAEQQGCRCGCKDR